MANREMSSPKAPEAGAKPEIDPVLGVRRAAVRHLIAPVALLSVGVVALTLALVGIAADSQNRLAIEAAGHLAESALRVEAEQVGGFVRDYAFWDEAAGNLVVEPDESWASRNIGAWAHDNLGMIASLVVDGTGQVIYGTVGGVREEGSGLAARFSPQLAKLVAAARTAVGKPRTSPVAVTSFLEFDGAVAIAAAAGIKWEGDRPVPERGGGPVVLVYVRAVDAAMLERLHQLFLLPDSRIVSASDSHPDSIPLRAIDGTVLARLAWNGTRPGTALVKELAGPLIGIVLLAAGLLFLIVYRARRSAADLTRSHEQLAAQAKALRASKAAMEAALGEAARANAAKSDFLARMSHELRTPLNAILGFSEIIAIQLYGPDAFERYREYARMIHDSGSHLRSLINDILDLAKIEAGRFDLREEDVDLGPIIEQCLGLLSPKMERKRLKVVRRPIGIRLRTDPRALKQILLNLLSNATKFTPEEGEISVRAVAGREGVAITVSDTGCGMSREDLDQVFKRFGQARAHLSSDYEGSGLGLNIAKGLVEMQDGTLTLASELGVGTTATVRLPASRLLPPITLADAG